MVLLLLLAGDQHLYAATVWTGPVITYTQPAPNPTQAGNQDRITPDVWLTRAASKGLFNAFYETSATTFSPMNTEWAFGSLASYASLNYTNWLVLLNGASPTTLIGQPMVVHLISDDIYLSINITAWTAGGSGGFAYQRSTPEPAINLSGTGLHGNQFTFGYNTVTGLSYVVQSSSNFENWVPLSTNVANGGQTLFTNVVNPTGTGFYRISRLLNP
ncbi:MAG TPA: hypothetical protein VG347_12385 [Verrucomicrobiae bacterium]|nr:hypothetical protein [Verrucomicrobiae bacterium]